ncbi:4-carboxymuconolactone decarboxylase / 3-oxoadipate enol-lactonase [Candidatus Sulfopaludibacter sp. SbA6]|nr:4-carboxymuconolactone decarboxylase / 3-oxoadipate enol-lactonase [Candidatus Sulfopaludibacter sp. SbA6]
MPFANLDGTRLYYRLEGLEDRPALVFSHSLGVDHGQWDLQVPALLPHFRILRYDIRGHGASDAPPGEYSIEQLARDVLAIVDRAGIGRFAFCGLSLGGMIGQWLGARAGDRLTHLVLAATSARLNNPSLMEERRKAVLSGGMAAIADAVMGRFFTPELLAANSPPIASTRSTLLATNPDGYAGCCAAIRDMDQRELLAEIRVPTLVLAGDRDASTPWTGNGDLLAQCIAGARAVRLPAAHLLNIGRPRSFSAALLEFLLPDPADRLQTGFAVRRAVLGDAHVDRAIARTTGFNRDFQDLITRYAWGTIWTRPGLMPRTRRLLVLATLVALGRWEEFRMHVRTGLAHELEPCDLKEVLLQSAIYAGVPAANMAFQIAAEELEQTRT